MRKVLGWLQLNFVPASVDLGLLALRVWLGLSMALLHGLAKLKGFEGMSKQFMSFMGLSPALSLGLAVFAELLCGILLAFGLITRLAALMLTITMAVAFFMAHGGKLVGPGNGEMAFIYLAGFVTILIAGPGKLSMDAQLGGVKR